MAQPATLTKIGVFHGDDLEQRLKNHDPRFNTFPLFLKQRPEVPKYLFYSENPEPLLVIVSNDQISPMTPEFPFTLQLSVTSESPVLNQEYASRFESGTGIKLRDAPQAIAYRSGLVGMVFPYFKGFGEAEVMDALRSLNEVSGLLPR